MRANGTPLNKLVYTMEGSNLGKGSSTCGIQSSWLASPLKNWEPPRPKLV
jgi:hypothetical protein